MAKSKYSANKRKKEMARKLKQEQKRERKVSNNKENLETDPNQPQDETSP